MIQSHDISENFGLQSLTTPTKMSCKIFLVASFLPSHSRGYLTPFHDSFVDFNLPV